MKRLTSTYRDRRVGGAGRAIALSVFCLGWFFRAPDDMDNKRPLPLESTKTDLLLHNYALCTHLSCL